MILEHRRKFVCTYFQLPSECDLLLRRHLEVFGDGDRLGKGNSQIKRRSEHTCPVLVLSECSVCRRDCDSQSGR